MNAETLAAIGLAGIVAIVLMAWARWFLIRRQMTPEQRKAFWRDADDEN